MGEFPPWSSAPRKIRLSEYGFFGIEVAGERARIQALYDSLKNSGGEVIWDYAGTALLDGAITPYSKIHAEGLGAATKVRLAAGANSHIFTVPAGGADFYSFSKLWIDGNKA